MRLEHHLVGGYVRYISPHNYYYQLVLLRLVKMTVKNAPVCTVIYFLFFEYTVHNIL